MGLQDSLTKGFARALKLRNLHINYPFEEDPDAEEDDDEYIPPVLSSGEALQIVRRCAPALVEFGCNSRVWKVSSCTIPVHCRINFASVDKLRGL